MFESAVFSPSFDIPFEAWVVDRQDELNQLSHVVLEKSRFVWIYGGFGTGKTTLLRLFASRFHDFFANHRTEIKYVYARKYEEVKKTIDDAIAKPSYDNTLVMIDESEHLSQLQLKEIVEQWQKHSTLKLVFSSRNRPQTKDPEILSRCYVLHLKSPSIRAVLEQRLQLLTDRDKRRKAKEIINEYVHTTEKATKTPREILLDINRLLNEYPDAKPFIPEHAIDTTKDESGGLLEIKVDFIGILVALVLFIISQITSNRTEDNITNKIESVRTAVESVVSLYTSERDTPFYVNRPANLRDAPTTRNSKVLLRLHANAVVFRIRSSENWMYVKYQDYVENADRYGWIYRAYLSEITGHSSNNGIQRIAKKAGSR